MLRALHAITSPQILLLGGNSEPHRVDAYDVMCNRWTELTETVIGREVFFEVLWLAGFVYVFCGIHHASYGMVERYNPLSNEWTEVTPLPGKLAAVVGGDKLHIMIPLKHIMINYYIPKHHLALPLITHPLILLPTQPLTYPITVISDLSQSAVLDGKIYIVGGYDWYLATYSDAVYTMEVDETAADSSGLVAWELLKCRLRMGRSSHACVAFEGKLWVAGGISDEGDSEGNPTVEILDPLLGYWVPGPSLNMRRFRLRLFVVCDALYAVGGDRDERGRLIIQSIEKLDPSGSSWSHVTFFKVERRGFLSSVVGSKIYIIGGRTGEVPLTTWDCYDVITDRWLSEVLPMTELDAHMKQQGLLLSSSSPKRAKIVDSSSGRMLSSSPVPFFGNTSSSSDVHASSSSSSMMMCMSPPPACLASPEVHPPMVIDSDCDEHSNMSVCNNNSNISNSNNSSSGAASGHGNSLSYSLGKPHTSLGVRYSKPLDIGDQEMELFGGANENKSRSSSGDILDEVEIEKDAAAAAVATGNTSICSNNRLDHCREWLLPSWADSANVSSTLSAGTSPCITAVFPMVTLNRLGGVVGGRAVTIPEATLKW